ncbi:Imm21 family immunity protein [Kitasatospora sp. NPDC086801]|uniref:Imm21 family immunity protein n=1 Tax=Kitasatospora sp. NPDC086801 TaxID=3364066 RepID=UPI0038025D8A
MNSDNAWVASASGPLILIPQSVCHQWGGAPRTYPADEGDHGRACVGDFASSRLQRLHREDSVALPGMTRRSCEPRWRRRASSTTIGKLNHNKEKVSQF